MDTKSSNKNLMTGYESRIFRGWKKSAADLLKDDKMVTNTLRSSLGVEVPVKMLDTGEIVNVPIVVDLIAAKLSYLKDHPRDIDLKELSTVLGEIKQDTNLNIQNASDVFKGCEVKKNDTDYK